MGVVVNNPADMTDLSSEFQVFVQALSAGGTYGGYNVAPGDFGGTALYVGKPCPGTPVRTFPTRSGPRNLPTSAP